MNGGRFDFQHFNRGPGGGGGGGGDAAAAATASLAGRELPADLVQQVSSVTMGQLFYILGHIQKLSAQAPVTAQALLAERPQICHALLHAECLAGMMEEPLLPMTADELQRTKATARRMREEVENHELPPPPEVAAAKAAMQSGISKYGKAAPPPGFAAAARAAACGAAGFCKAPPGAPPPPPPLHHGLPQAGHLMAMQQQGLRQPPPVAHAAAQAQAAGHAGHMGHGGDPFAAMAAASGGPPGDEKQQLMEKLVLLTPEQIARLPEQTKVQLLQFLQQNSQ